MARIRSIHPGLFTDEQFACLSDAAQVFYLGLLTEADDQGIFEWKPVTLRMRLRPSKDGSVDELLAEIEQAEKISRYELGGRKYGAIRNFRKFQRPKSPNSIHPTTPEWKAYVGLTDANSEPPPPDCHPFPQKGEIPPQREEEGGRRKEECLTTNDSVETGGAPSGAVAVATSPPIKQAVDAFNEVAQRVGWSRVQNISDARRKGLRARLAECGGIDGWLVALEKAEASDFLAGRMPPGEDHENWRMDFDFLLKPKRFTKLMEGGYANRTSPVPGKRESQTEAIARGAQALIDSGFVPEGL